MARLGKNQLYLLRALSAVTAAMVVGNKVSASLVKRGLLSAQPDGSFVHITPCGLRVLADEIEAGRAEGFSIEKLRTEPEAA